MFSWKMHHTALICKDDAHEFKTNPDRQTMCNSKVEISAILIWRYMCNSKEKGGFKLPIKKERRERGKQERKTQDMDYEV